MVGPRYYHVTTVNSIEFIETSNNNENHFNADIMVADNKNSISTVEEL